MTLYFLSGLGADKRVFKKLTLPPSYTIVHIDWIVPAKDESIENYALRLSAVINTDEPFSIIGLSFGGMIATELSKIVSPQKVIIISSVAANDEFPWYFRPLKYLNLQLLVSEKYLKKKNKILYWIIGAESIKEKALIHQIAKETDLIFFKWAITQILHWKQKQPIHNLARIHGTNDYIFPVRNISSSHNIKHGGHLMVYAQANEVSNVLTNLLLRH